jgi:chromosome segregation ATPase
MNQISRLKERISALEKQAQTHMENWNMLQTQLDIAQKEKRDLQWDLAGFQEQVRGLQNNFALLRGYVTEYALALSTNDRSERIVYLQKRIAETYSDLEDRGTGAAGQGCRGLSNNPGDPAIALPK